MTYIPCHLCGNIWCCCRHTPNSATFQYIPETKLSNADIERIAQRVVELLKEQGK